MKLIEVTHQKDWGLFVSSRVRSQFTQSWAWGEFKASLGHDVKRFALTNDGSWIAAGTFIFHPTKYLNGYWYCPRGPVVQDSNENGIERVLKEFADQLSKKDMLPSALFWRIEPPIVIKKEEVTMPKGWVKSHAYMPASTLLIDLSKSEEQLLKEMHEKTRYNIRLSERKGVTVRTGVAQDEIDIFLKLNEQTAERDKFVSQPASYIKQTIEFLSSKQMATVRIAEFEGKPLAASIEIHFGDTVTYLYGASSNEKRNVMAPYALHWQAMKDAKQAGKHYYDMHGVNPEDETSKYFKASWAGITRFKFGFGGERVNYIGTWELPQRKILYQLMRLVRK